MDNLHRARAIAAERFPEHLVDSKGRKHASIIRRSILAGHCDAGALVKDALVMVEGGGA